MPDLPMFPLGSVLFPHMPLHLRIFEERYLVMLGDILDEERPEFGVVLIERGQEVGGGERRFSIGTVARATQIESAGVLEEAVGEGADVAAAGAMILVAAVGEHRIEVESWLDDDPYPRASVRQLPALEWDDGLWSLRMRAETAVRRALALGAEREEQHWSASVVVSEDPVEAAWQLAAIAPLAELDQMELLRSPSMRELLRSLIDLTESAVELYTD